MALERNKHCSTVLPFPILKLAALTSRKGVLLFKKNCCYFKELFKGWPFTNVYT